MNVFTLKRVSRVVAARKRAIASTFCIGVVALFFQNCDKPYELSFQDDLSSEEPAIGGSSNGGTTNGGSNNGGSTSGQPSGQPTSGPLYNFSSHTFSTCGATGKDGPQLADCLITYSTTWDENPSFYNMEARGIQRWTVPETATYRITASGASKAGSGATLFGSFSLTAGQHLYIVVGQTSLIAFGDGDGTTTTGGAGGSFVYSDPGEGPFMVAGGGGGYGWHTSPSHSGMDASITDRAGNSPSCGPPASNGEGGNQGDISTTHYGAGGAGWNSDGKAGWANGGGFSLNFRGGEGNLGNGGFGGGAGNQHRGGGGGGGYTGGSGGDHDLPGCGGGSFNSGMNAGTLGANSGEGEVIIEKL